MFGGHVERSPNDIELTLTALEENRLANEVVVVRDGDEALDYLHRRAPYEAASRPDMVLLDLNLPRMDGREVLAAIKSDPVLKVIPVVVLTTSEAEEDVLRAYNLAANCYVTKPVDLHHFTRIVRGLEDFWLTIVTLPPR